MEIYKKKKKKKKKNITRHTETPADDVSRFSIFTLLVKNIYIIFFLNTLKIIFFSFFSPFFIHFFFFFFFLAIDIQFSFFVFFLFGYRERERETMKRTGKTFLEQSHLG